ncbi:uncharacterized protein LOC129768404 [Toxorhynchites rutilus septentrionalis]|uniref:uncharacterized protein LOC129768404 n=1 Tax=Toxorhynchites rutilus septentrionalis TaxID=329112 RepID=UPI0024798D4E|nr:uncharacterized protein LOC129768404 [Toxorhynchites rutilus septentrionalis]
MGVIEDELAEVTRRCSVEMPDATILECTNIRIMVDIRQTQSRHLVVLLCYPLDYPENKMQLEFRSQTLSEIFMEQLANICDDESAHFRGRPQAMNILLFIDHFLRNNPLCIVTREVFNLRKHLEGSNGTMKLRHPTSMVCLSARGGYYYFNARFFVPEGYPAEQIKWDTCTSNLPAALKLYVDGQAREIARQCVEPPPSEVESSQPFVPIPSLERTLQFIIEALDGFDEELCPICHEFSLPESPKEVATSDEDDRFVIRMVCGHVYHNGCLKRFLKEPPIPPDGKLCPAERKHPRSDNIGEWRFENRSDPCRERISYDTWGTNNIQPAEVQQPTAEADLSADAEELADAGEMADAGQPADAEQPND